MKTNPNEPANPISEEETDRIDAGVKIYSGLTKREHFAAMAMQGLLAAGAHYSTLSEKAVVIADALIIELNK